MRWKDLRLATKFHRGTTLLQKDERSPVKLMAGSGGQIPAFVFHLLVAPVLKLFKESGIDDCEAKADAPFVAHPDDSGLGAKDRLGVGKWEAHIEQAGKAHRFLKAIQPHAARAEVHALDAYLIAMLVFQCNGKLNARTKKFLLLETNESQWVRILPWCDVDVVLLQLAAEGAAGNAQLVRCRAAMAATPLERADDHLLLHADEVADGHGGGLAQSGRAPGHCCRDLRGLNLRMVCLHGNSGDQVAQFANISRPRVREQRGNSIGHEGTARSFQMKEMLS